MWYHKGIEEYARLSEISMMEGHYDMTGSYSPLCLAAEGQEFLSLLWEIDLCDQISEMSIWNGKRVCGEGTLLL